MLRPCWINIVTNTSVATCTQIYGYSTFFVWPGHEVNIVTHLAVHLLEHFQLGSLIGPIKRVVALVPVCHHPPSLESSLLTSYGLLCKCPCWIGWRYHFKAAVNLKGMKSLQRSVCLYLSAGSEADQVHWSPCHPVPSARWVGRGSPNLGCSGPVVPSAFQNGYGYLSGSGSNRTKQLGWLFW